MKTRGQNQFINLPPFAAALYAALTDAHAIRRQHHDIAADIMPRIQSGRLLDIGPGPGTLLAEIHRINPDLDLYGLDISPAMIGLAQKRLGDLPVQLQTGDIRKTGYPDGFFDLVTCTGSFYLWDQPERGLKEIFRILKPGGSALLYETYRDHDRRAVRKAMRRNLRTENLLRQLLTPFFLLRQFRMTYSIDELSAILAKTPFAKHYAIEKITLGGLPAWVRIRLPR